MLCCLNPGCHNPSHSDDTKFCSHCGVPLVILRHRYRPIKPLGSGGFGKTYLAEDIDKLNEKCVIKQFAPQAQGSTALRKAMELFEQEARQLQKLGEHPQIPRLLAYFEDEHRLYLVQQFVDGQNLLEELKKQGIFDKQKIRDLLLELLEILKFVHLHKVVHRDIKPENIIRRRSDNKLVLIDFGASKQLKTTIMAGEGTTIGTYGYVPMEQMQSGEAYPASDLYSLGATCFHLWSGIHPWNLWKIQAYGWVNNWREQLQQKVDKELGRVFDKLLHNDYRQRYQSVEEAITDLTTKRFSQPAHPPNQQTQSPNKNQSVNHLKTQLSKDISSKEFRIFIIILAALPVLYGQIQRLIQPNSSPQSSPGPNSTTLPVTTRSLDNLQQGWVMRTTQSTTKFNETVSLPNQTYLEVIDTTPTSISVSETGGAFIELRVCSDPNKTPPETPQQTLKVNLKQLKAAKVEVLRSGQTNPCNIVPG